MGTPGSSDEGEILERGGGRSKATALPQSRGAGVDRVDRQRARSPERPRSPRHRQSHTAQRSRSPRGNKRLRDDRDRFPAGGRVNDDPRRFRVHYEDNRERNGRSRLSYDDEDRPSQSSSSLHYEDRTERDHARGSARDRSRDRESDRYPEKRSRQRSRTPERAHRGAFNGRTDPRRRDVRPNREDHSGGRQASVRGQPEAHNEQHVRPPGATYEGADGSSLSNTLGTTAAIDDRDFEEEKPVDVDAEIERRRRKREELLAKSRGATPMLVQALQTSARAAETPQADTTRAGTPMAVDTPGSVVSSPASPSTPLRDGFSPAPPNLSKDPGSLLSSTRIIGSEEDGPSAADYDPTADMREDELRDELRHGQIGPHGERLPANEKAAILPSQPDEAAKQPEQDDEDGEFDMFAEEIDEDKLAAPKPMPLSTITDDRKLPATLTQSKAGGILEGDDLDGYYKIRIGEIMEGRYQVQSTLGKGMFSGVVRAVDITNKSLVAVKMMRNNDALRKGGFTEIAILQKLNEADPENRKHIVKFERYFEHKAHLCLAFENLSYNLREVLKKFGNNVGINLSATRTYAHQMFVALAHMRKCSIVHADLKPDNILTDEKCTILKICDLGTAIDKSDAATAHNEITPYLVSRFYRAPEIMLGMPYDYAIDMWSIGCTLYEMYTGKILFTGNSNNQMLKTIIEIRGKFSAKLYRRGELAPLHFDEMGNFISVEQDKVLGKTTVKTLAVVKPTRDLRTRLLAASSGLSEIALRDLNHFIDLLERCLALNPDKRITPVEALKHPFFSSKTAVAFKQK